MRLNTPLTPLFACPIEEILAVLPGETDPLWNASRLRQGRFPVHSATRSITVRWLETLTPAGPQPVMIADGLPRRLRLAAADCAAAIERHYGGTLVRLLLVELAAGAKIGAHRDSGVLLSSTHRCHLPIETNPDVSFTIDGETFHLEAGVVYEMDNMRPHAVENCGPTRRVHMVCNILPARDAA